VGKGGGQPPSTCAGVCFGGVWEVGKGGGVNPPVPVQVCSSGGVQTWAASVWKVQPGDVMGLSSKPCGVGGLAVQQGVDDTTHVC
jgi:hypothetical protein